MANLKDPSGFAAGLRGQRVVVVGLGASGVAAAELCAAWGANVTATDRATSDGLEATARILRSRGVEVVLGGHAGVPFTSSDWVIVSPGVPAFQELVAADEAGIPVIGEIELASRFFGDVPTIAITGSNGKSTTTTLVGDLLTSGGLRPFVGGNLGDPPARVVPKSPDDDFPHDVVVLEISSFQAERVPGFRPTVAALLNVSANHLDRYDSFDHYVRAKGNLFVNQREGDEAVVPSADTRCVAQAERGRGKALYFGRDDRCQFVIRDDAIVDVRRDRRFSRKNIRLVGEHNMENVAAALAMVERFALPEALIGEVLERFEGLPHRLAFVRELDGARYYDDSKGTSVGAAVAAIDGLPEARVVLIAGGRDKLGSYEPLAEALLRRGRGIVLIGEAAARIAASMPEGFPVARAVDMAEAVTLSRRMAENGDAVLLSPTCSSFDMFRDYKHRGDVFVEAVRALH